MKANELRIGNWFNGYDKNEYQWSLTNFEMISQGIEVDEIIQSFIPLTEEWLLKFGFEEDEKEELVLKHELITIVQTRFLDLWEIRVGSIRRNKIPILNENFKYVHQLQNLYFALTGEELTINE